MMELNTQKMEDFKGRYKFFLAVLVLAFVVLFIRLWQLEVVRGTELLRLSENNRIRLRETPAERGMLLDHNGEILAHNRPYFEVSLVPEDVKGSPEVLPQVGEILKMDPAEIQEKLQNAKNRPPFQPVKVKTDINWSEVAVLESNRVHLPGVITDVRSTRAYNYGPLAAHLIGYIGEVDENDLRKGNGSSYRMGSTLGKYGVESQWESDLKGVDGGRQVEVDALGREIKPLRSVESFPGNNLYLTLDLDLQRAAEEAYQDKSGALVAMDPKTGRVLAMVSKPAFDPSLFAGTISAEDWKALQENPFHPLQNKTIQGLYPPGSTFKIITAIAGLESGTLTPNTTFTCTGSFFYGNREFRCWKEGGHGTIDLHRALVTSCDVYFYQAGLKVGVDRIAKYANAFGLGRKTGISFPHEKSGIVPSTAWKMNLYGVPWYSGETLSLAVGQGYISVTPLQLARMMSAVANGGTLFLPQVVEKVEDIYGRVLRQYSPVEMGSVDISQATLDFIRSALRGVVHEPGGTATGIALKEIEMAGKTGTAQVIKLAKDFKRGDMNRMPLKFRDHAWFVAYAPVADPQIAVAVLVEHGGFGASAAAPIAKKVIARYFKIGLPPTEKGSERGEDTDVTEGD
jgi:penicillin-binding protein 2